MKRLMLITLCILLVLSAPLSVLASAPKIVDGAGLLTASEIADLEMHAQTIADQYGMDVVIVTVNSLGGKSSESFADDYFDDNGYGIGPSYNGVLLLLSMEYRDWAISTCGEAIYAITDYGIQDLFSQIADYLSEDHYYQAFSTYLDALEILFAAYESGQPIDGNIGSYDGPGTYIPGTQEGVVHYEPSKDLQWYAKRIGISFGIGLVIAMIVLMVMRGQMNTARAQHGAASYLVQNTYRIGIQRDIFLYSQLSKVRKSENSSSSGGGSSTHRSSSGRSHGGGHGKF